LPSIGIGALSTREAEGRTNISAGEKVFILSWLFALLDSFLFSLRTYIIVGFFSFRKYTSLLFFMFQNFIMPFHCY
jgi:hypothetical protein